MTLSKLLCCVCLLAFAAVGVAQQPLADGAGEKLRLYNEAVKLQAEQEARAQYSGDDEIIRRRLDLPPKLPPFEQWTAPAGTHTTRGDAQVVAPHPPVSSEPANAKATNEKKPESEQPQAVAPSQASGPAQTSTGDTTWPPPGYGERSNVDLWLWLGGAIAYLVVVVFLYFARNSSGPYAKLAGVSYNVLMFPLIAAGFLFLMALKSGGTSSSSRAGSSRTAGSSRNEESEPVEIQFQDQAGSWNTSNTLFSVNDQAIHHALNSVQNGPAQFGTSTGRVRARGRNTGKIYDVR
jgi:hypothetical protein